MNKKYLPIGGSILISVAILAWLFIISLNPDEKLLPGQKIEDLGREHISNISGITYNSNPPTSGSHFSIWAKKGVYDRVISDGYLIHSLEHGYIVLSYNCDKQLTMDIGELTKKLSNVKFQMSNVALAHEGEPVEIHDIATSSAVPLMQMRTQVSDNMSAFTPQNPPEKEIELSQEFESDSCKELVSQLGSFLNDFQRIIVVPDPDMETRIALTAWTRIETLNNFDKDKIETFIKAFHNKGPEKTVE